MLPQVPIDRFIVDFGDPKNKIAIECGGARWHSLARDEPRDQELASLGWLVFRLPGTELFAGEGGLAKVRKNFYDDEELVQVEIDKWAQGNPAGFFHVLLGVFYGRRLECSLGAAFRTLASHCLVPETLQKRLETSSSSFGNR